MPTNEFSQMKRHMTMADNYEKKGDEEWSKAKKGRGDEHYDEARKDYEKMRDHRQKASDTLFNGKISGRPF